MLHNSSHLEAVNPVSMGKTRSKQQTRCDGAFSNNPNKQFGSNVINVQVCSRIGYNEKPLLSFSTIQFRLTISFSIFWYPIKKRKFVWNFRFVSFMVMLDLLAKE